MKLTIKVNSKLNINYKPISIQFISPDNKPKTLFLVIKADYSIKEPFTVQCNGELFPLALYGQDDGYLDFEDMEKRFENYSKEKIQKFIEKSNKATISLVPYDEQDWEKCWSNDEWCDTQGVIEYESKDGLLVKNFTFEAELAF